MNKKGFTLTEILGVMTLLAVIFAFVFPNVMNMMEQGKETEYEEYLSNVYLSAEAYVNSDSTLSTKLSTDKKLEVSFDSLLSSGYLSSKLVNPKNGKKTSNLSNNIVVITVASDNTFEYSIRES